MVIVPLSVGSITECLLFGDSMTGTARKGKVKRSVVSVLLSGTVRESNSLVFQVKKKEKQKRIGPIKSMSK